MKKHTQALENLGLTPNEAKIYQALLELKNGTIWDISKKADIHRRNSYDAIKRLIDRGLAYQVLPKKTLTYAPVHPNKLKELVEEKVQSLNTALPGLTARFEQLKTEQSLVIYKGLQGLRNYLQLVLDTAAPMYVIGSKALFYEESLGNFAKNNLAKMRKLKGRVLYDHSLKAEQDKLKKLNKEYKFIPKKYSTDSTVAIFGDYVAIYSGVHTKAVDEDITIFILKEKTMAEDYRKWFDFMWEHLD